MSVDLVQSHFGEALEFARKRAVQRKVPHLSDEFESASAVAIMKAAESYSPDRGVKFAGFMRMCLDRAFSGVMRDSFPKGFRKGRGGPPPLVSSLNDLNANPHLSRACPAWEEASFREEVAMRRGDRVRLMAGARAKAAARLAAATDPARVAALVALIGRHDATLARLTGGGIR